MCDLSRVVCGCSGDKAHRSNGRERVPGYSPCESHGHVRDRVWVALFDVAQVLGDCVRPGLPRESCPACDSVIRSRVGVQQIADRPHPR